jgi:tryptophan-rich sensory protein
LQFARSIWAEPNGASVQQIDGEACRIVYRKMTSALVYSLGACALSVALEGLFAGGGIKQRLKEMRLPRYVPPLWGSAIIGALYYVICFVLLYRILSLSAPEPARRPALCMIASIMFINALWNCFFFRTRNLLIGLPYGLIAVALFAFLLRIDLVSACCLLPYLAYLLYANALAIAFGS